MADLLTVYDDEQANSFIDCTICDKRIRGETHYKIHVTTLQHLKVMSALLYQSQKPHPLPEWTDIREYLEYLNLDEPIIGLNSLIQVPDHGKTVLKYKCRMCVVEMDLYSMVAHIVGCKHRQKYLVWWLCSSFKGLPLYSKAAVVEKQEGWGNELRASVHYGQYSLKKSPFPEQVQKQRYLDEDLHERPYYTADKYDQYNRPNPKENRHQKPYEDADIRGGHSQGDDYPEREMHTRPYGDQGGRRLCEDYEGKCLGGGQFSGGKINRFNDLRIRPGASEYQKEQMQGRRNVDYEERNPAMNPMSMHGRSFNEEKRGTVRETHGRTWDKANEVPGYPPMFQPRDPRAYSQEATPAKKKKKSRFSDVTAEEIALAHTRHSNKSSPRKKPRGAPFRTNPLVKPQRQ
uniref:Uncharacterized protein n=1 Tax=Cyprinus carpio TaxID=7962 RepID=A0A8C1P6A9_CYPCA